MVQCLEKQLQHLGDCLCPGKGEIGRLDLPGDPGGSYRQARYKHRRHRQCHAGDRFDARVRDVYKRQAQIYTTISGRTPQCYDIVIESVNLSSTAKTKSMVIRVTDPELLEATGGILQGMSGSPILQDGKLVGAVTHVFVNDQTRGYGIFAENMQETASSLEIRSAA